MPQEKRIYQLKDKHLERQAKGHLIVTFDLIFNPIRASLRTFNPREVNALYDPPRFRRQVRKTVVHCFTVSHRKDSVMKFLPKW